LKYIDLHNHAKLSKTFDLDETVFDRYVRRARRIGLDGFALTEHFHAVNYWEVYKALFRRFPYRDGMFWPGEDLCILPGAEVRIREGADVIVIGPIAELKKLDEAFPLRLSEQYFPRFSEFLDEAARCDLILIGAHMFREQKELSKFGAAELRRLHAVEVNGKDFGTEERLVEQAREMRLAVVGGSDAHHVLQLGVRATRFPLERVSWSGLRDAVVRRETSYWTGRGTFLRVVTAKRIKTWQKRLRHLRGWLGPIRISPFNPAKA
jgi:histidinol phosphatase-like PHP family hydrolase